MTEAQDNHNQDSVALTRWYADAMEKLVDVVQKLSLARDLDAVMDIVRHAARDLTGADGATFVLRDGDKCFYADENAISPLWKGQRFPMSACISGWVMLNQESAVIEDIYTDSRIPADVYRPTFVKSLAMVPIRKIDPIGAIGNYWANQQEPGAEQIKVLQALADTTAVALENVRVYSELEDRVKKRTSELQAILDNVQVGVAFTVDNAIVSANPKTAEIFGAASSHDLIGKPLQSLLRPLQDQSDPFAAVEDKLLTDNLYSADVILARRDSSRFWARLIAKDLSPHGVIWVIEDISESKAKEKALDELRISAEEATRSKSEFLASMSHELRTPLNAILGFSEVLRDGLAGELKDKQYEYVSDIFESGQHLLSLINDVLDLSKVEAGKMQLECENVDISLLLDNSLSIIKERAMTSRISIINEIPKDLGEIWIDPRKCKQIVYNLLSNAVKFTREGGRVSIRASVVERTEAALQADQLDQVHPDFESINGERLIEISVQDTGIGIRKADMESLFQPFVQLDSSLSRQFDGTGLGLALVLKLVNLHGGGVGLSSNLNEGSTFTVWLPYRLFGQQQRVSTKSPCAETPSSGAKPLALVIEDDDKAADLLRLQLESNGCQVIRTATAKHAIAILQETIPDVVTLDLLLPEMDGWTFLEAFKRDPKFAGIPVVIVSIVGDGEMGITLGSADMLQKPVLTEELVSALQKIGLITKNEHELAATVMVVDDDPRVLEIVTHYLEQIGCSVLEVSNGKNAVDVALNKAPDLILLDLMMPGMNGFEVIEELGRHDLTVSIPIVVLTAKELTESDRKRLSDQVRRVIEKSKFNRSRFVGEIRRALAKQLESGNGNSISG